MNTESQRRSISRTNIQDPGDGNSDAVFFRFLLVGCLNTAVGYGLFTIFILLGMSSALALLIATVLGVLFNYMSTGRLVFARPGGDCLWRFVLGYTVLYGLNAAALAVLERVSGKPLLAQALLLPLIVGLSFLYNKYFVFTGTGARPR